MKKHAFRIGLVVTMLLGLMTISANAANCTGDHDGATKWTPNGGAEDLTTGTYVLSADTTVNGQLTIKGEVTICLNGHTLDFTHASGTVTAAGSVSSVKRAFGFSGANRVLNICDCGGTGDTEGKITASNSTNDNTISLLYTGAATPTLNLYGGKVCGFNSSIGLVNFAASGAKFTVDGGTIDSCVNTRGLVYSAMSCTVNLESGTISNNNNRSNSSGLLSGSASYLKTLNIYDGMSINGNAAYTGSVVRTDAKTTVNIYGGTISGNVPRSGTYALYAYADGGKIIISGGTISDPIGYAAGTLSVSGGTFVQDMSKYVAAGYKCTDNDDGTYTVELKTDGEEIHDDGLYWEKLTAETGTELSNGRYYLSEDLPLSSTLTISGAVDLCLHGHTLTSSAADNAIVVSSGATLTLCEGCTEAAAGTITADEGIISRAIQINGGTVKMYGGTITGFTTDGDGGAVLIPSDSGGTFTMSNGTITDNTAANGGGVCCKKGTVTLSGGTISNNTATDAGGGIQAQTVSTTVNLNGVVITGNTAKNGGGVNTASGAAKIIMTAGEISNNTATTGDGGGLRLNFGADGTMSGGFIYGNKSGGHGPGVYLINNGAGNDSTFEVTGGSIGLNGNDEPAANVNTDGTQAEGTAVYVTGGAATIKGGKFYCNKANAETPDTVFFGDGVDASAAQLNDEPKAAHLATDCMTYQVSDNGDILIYEVAAKIKAPYNARVLVGNDLRLRFLIYTDERNPIPGSYKDDYTVKFSNGTTTTMSSNTADTARFEYSFAAKDMADDFTVTIVNNNNTVNTWTYNVKQWIDTTVSDSTGSVKDDQKTALKYLAKYGEAAQTYFNHKTNNLVTTGLTTDLSTLETLWDVNRVDTAAMYDLANDMTGLYLGSSLSLKEQVKLNLHFADSVTKVTVGGKEHTPVNGVVTISPSLKDATTLFTIEITAGETTVTVKDSIQAYAYRATKLAETEEQKADLVALCQAMMDLVTFANEKQL